MIKVAADLVIRKVESGAFEARLVNPANHSETYARGSWGLTEAEAIRNLQRGHVVTLPENFQIEIDRQ
jgi:hypothetical protein